MTNAKLGLDDMRRLHDLLLANWNMMSWDRKLNIVNQIVNTHYVEGDVVEIGCYDGQTTCLMRWVLDTLGSDRDIHVYDSFEGLLGRNEHDGGPDLARQFPDGFLKTSPEIVYHHFNKYQLRPPVIHKGVVQKMSPSDLPVSISMALLDVDLYEPMLKSIELVWPRMAPGGMMVVDDYRHGCWPGVERALCDYFGTLDWVQRIDGGQGVVRKA